MSITICDRCGDIAVDPEPCRCATPCDLFEVHRRYRLAVARARARTATDRRHAPKPIPRAA